MKYPKAALAALVFLFAAILAAAPAAAQEEHEHPSAGTGQEALQGTPWLGITIQEMNEETAAAMGLEETGGVLVADIAEGGPADEAGLNMGDVIVRLNGEDVAGADDFISRIRSAGIGNTVALDVNRGGEMESVNIQLGAMPSSMTSSRRGMGGMGMMGMGQGMDRGMGQGAMSCPSSGASPCPMGGDCPMARGGHDHDCPSCPMGMTKGPGHMMGGPLGPAYGRLMAAIKTLDLTPEQRARASAIHRDFKKKAIRAKAEIKVASMELQELLAADPVNTDKVRAKVGEIASKGSDLMITGVRSLEEFKKILTPEQRTRLKEMVSMDSGDAMEME